MADVEREDNKKGNDGSKSQEYMGSAGGGDADMTSNESGERVNDFQDPHGNQTLREPSGGSGAAHSRGGESTFLPPEPAERERNPRSDSAPMKESDEG